MPDFWNLATGRESYSPLRPDQYLIFWTLREMRKRPYSRVAEPSAQMKCPIVTRVDGNMGAPGALIPVEEQKVERLILIDLDRMFCIVPQIA
ncbi:hypothetical protein Q2941_11090 [Bradyrhizobium sp. UFLA05-153]